MKLVTIGNTTINMDTVREIRAAPGLLTIMFVDGHEMQISGAEMEGMQRWINSHGEEVLDRPHHQGPSRLPG